MTTWLQAHQAANLAAAQAHADLGVDPSRFPVDVYSAIGVAGVMLMWRPLPRAFGLYVNAAGSRPGILLNNRLKPAVQRHTAGHELGHHYLGHGSRVDVDLDPFTAAGRGWTPTEKAAEAFAVWFLMPRRAVAAAMTALNLDRVRTPEEIYQLSLLLGTSYQSTVRHLVNIRLATPGQTRAWIAVAPGRIKQRLDPGVTPPSQAREVWRIDRARAASTVTACPGDRIVIGLGGAAEALHVTVGVDEPTPLRLVATRPGRPAPPLSTARSCMTVEVPPGLRSRPGRVEVRVGSPDDDRGWTFTLVIEQTRLGLLVPLPPPTGARRTIPITDTDTDTDTEDALW